MGRFRQVLDTVQRYVSSLSATQKLLVASLTVVMLMTLFVVQQYASEPALAPVLPGASAEDQERAMTSLASTGFTPKQENGQVVVPPGMVHRARAYLVESGSAPADTSIMFDNLVDNWSWTMPNEQQSKLETIAVQNELAKIIGAMSGIERARVILNIRQKRTLGAPSTRPSASVTVFPSGKLDQKTVDSISNLVSSARGIDLERVKVIDGVNNRQYSGRSETDFHATSYPEYVAAIEDRKRNQLVDLLTYIPGVNVSIHAQVDNTRAEKQTTSYLQQGEGTVNPVTSELAQESELSSPTRGGEPGVRSNVGASVGGGNTSSSETSTESTTETTFTPNVGSEREVVVDPRGRPTKINAIVNIPRPYFAAIWSQRQRQGGDGANDGDGQGEGGVGPPADEDLQPIIDSETQRVQAEVEKLIDTSAPPGGGAQYTGEVIVSMIPSAEDLGIQREGVAGAGTFMGIPAGSVSVQETFKTVGLGVLAVLSLAMLVVTATRASKREKLPSAEELVGMPKELDENEEILGEAVEADAALDGMELSEEDMRRRTVEQQVGELVNENPDDAARLLGKWITEEQT